MKNVRIDTYLLTFPKDKYRCELQLSLANPTAQSKSATVPATTGTTIVLHNPENKLKILRRTTSAMSFGFMVGDFRVGGILLWEVYSACIYRCLKAIPQFLARYVILPY